MLNKRFKCFTLVINSITLNYIFFNLTACLACFKLCTALCYTKVVNVCYTNIFFNKSSLKTLISILSCVIMK